MKAKTIRNYVLKISKITSLSIILFSCLFFVFCHTFKHLPIAINNYEEPEKFWETKIYTINLCLIGGNNTREHLMVTCAI